MSCVIFNIISFITKIYIINSNIQKSKNRTTYILVRFKIKLHTIRLFFIIIGIPCCLKIICFNYYFFCVVQSIAHTYTYLGKIFLKAVAYMNNLTVDKITNNKTAQIMQFAIVRILSNTELSNLVTEHIEVLQSAHDNKA